MAFDYQAAAQDLRAAHEAATTAKMAFDGGDASQQVVMQKAQAKAQSIVSVMSAAKERDAAAAGKGAAEAPTAATTPHVDFPTGIKQVGASAAGSALISAMTPEILRGVGKGLELASPVVGAIPYAGKALGPLAKAGGLYLQAGGAAAARVGRSWQALAGALSGGVAESGGILSDNAGFGPVVGTGTRLLLGMTTPLASTLASATFTNSRNVLALAAKAVGKEPAISAMEAAAKQNLTKDVVKLQPQLDMHVGLQKAVEEARQHAEEAARKTVAAAEAKAAELAKSDPAAAHRAIAEGEAQAKALRDDAAARATALNKAAGGKLDLAHRVAASADKHLEGVVGRPAEHGEIGGVLRQAVLTEKGAEVAAKNAAYDKTVAIRDAVVGRRVAAGQYMDVAPGMKDYRTELATQLLKPEGLAAANGVRQVADSGIYAALDKLYKATAVARKPIGTNEFGEPVFKEFKPDFAAIDAVRMQLAEVAFGTEAQAALSPYKQLGARVARKNYDKLSEIQAGYAGEAQRVLQQDYHDAKVGLSKFDGKAGTKITALDKLNMEEFVRDPATIPRDFFKSAQSVQHLVELTGNKALVHEAATAFAARQMQGHGSAQVENWLRNPAQTEWMKEIPGLAAKSEEYLKTLRRIETARDTLKGQHASWSTEAVAGVQAAQVAGAQARVGALKEAGDRVASRVEGRQQMVEGVRKEAQAVRDAVVKRAEGVVKEGMPAEAVRKLLMEGTVEEKLLATRYLAGTPGGKTALVGSVRNVLATVPMAQLPKYWAEHLQPVLKAGGLVAGKELAKLTADVERVIATREPKVAVPLVQKMIMGAIAAEGGAGAAKVRGMAAGQGQEMSAE